MATSASIAIEMQDGKIREVYVSSDGYLDHTGKTLLQHYTDPVVVMELIERGSIMILKSSVDETIFFGATDPDDADINCFSYDSWDEYVTADGDSLNYIMRNDGVWYFKKIEYDMSTKKWKKLPTQVSCLDEVVEFSESELNPKPTNNVDSESYEDCYIQSLKKQIQFLQQQVDHLESNKKSHQQRQTNVLEPLTDEEMEERYLESWQEWGSDN